MSEKLHAKYGDNRALYELTDLHELPYDKKQILVNALLTKDLSKPGYVFPLPDDAWVHVKESHPKSSTEK